MWLWSHTPVKHGPSLGAEPSPRGARGQGAEASGGPETGLGPKVGIAGGGVDPDPELGARPPPGGGLGAGRGAPLGATPAQARPALDPGPRTLDPQPGGAQGGPQ